MTQPEEDPRIVKAREQLRKAEAEVRAEQEARWESERKTEEETERQRKKAAALQRVRTRAQALIRGGLSDDPDSMGIRAFAVFEKVVQEELKQAGRATSPDLVTAIALSARMLDVIAARYADGYDRDDRRF